MPNRFRRRAGVLALVLVTAGCGPASVAPPATDAPPDGTPPVATALPRTPPSGPSEPNPATPFDPTAVTIALEEVVPLPGAPVTIAAPHDGSGRLFVAERGGQVWVVRDGRRSQQPFLDVAARVTAGGERGLLGLAVTPEFPDDPRFFIYYTNLDEDQVVEERRLDPGDADRADPGYEREILRMDDFAGNHNGGALAFGPDGFLYIATGDGGGAGDPQETGQRTDTYLGKILRIGVEPRDAPRDYQLPPDNPLAGQGGLPEIWHLGLRNPWRFSFDRATGDLWIGDVGQGQWEEIDVARGGAGGLNFGWSITEGRHCFRDEGCSMEGLTPPVTEYSHDFGCSVTGGVVYRGSRWPAFVGAYLFADYCSGLVWAIDSTADAVAEPVVVAESGRAISSFGEDEAGEVYATDLDGALLRVAAPER